MSSLCPQCNFSNPPGMRFCGSCGARLGLTGALPATAPLAPGLAPEGMGAMVGSDLLDRFRQAGLEAAGQRRNVSVLFADISGYTSLSRQIDNEDLYGLIQQILYALAQDVYKYAGMVDKFTGDGLMALFGAPLAQENHAELALRAALEMQTDVARLSRDLAGRLGTEIHIRIGLHCGSVVVGSVGSNLLMNYTAIGNTVNLASRLADAAAPGRILVSEAVYRLTGALFDCERVPPLPLKGFSEPVPGYYVLGARTTPGPVRGLEQLGLHAPLVGRDAELGQLKRVALALAHGQTGQLVLITGEAGFGKSRLTAEFKAFLKPSPVRVVEGHSLTYRRSVSYWVILEILRDLLGLTAESPEALVREKLSQAAGQLRGPAAAESLPYLEQLFSLKPGDPVSAERLEYLEPGQLRQQTFLAVRDLLVAEAGRQPLALILEDLHWADDISMDLLLFLVDSVRQAPLLLYAISRPFDGGPLARLAEQAQKRLGDRFTSIGLHSLSPDQTGQLLSQLLAAGDLPEHMRAHILARSAGVPFYLEEILRMLIDAEILQRDVQTDRWNVAPGVEAGAVGVPETLQDLILTRFDRLDEAQRRCLQVAAVIGQQFGLPLLKAVLSQIDEVVLQSNLERLVERQFIAAQADGPEQTYAFRHALVSDAIYSTLLRRDRTDIHGQVAAALEAVYAGQIDAQVDLLAGHYLRSEHLDRALPYLILAAQKSARGYANAQARQYYEQALELIPRVPHQLEQIVQLRMGLGDVLSFTGEYPAARAHYESALEAISLEDARRYAVDRSTLQRKAGMTFERQGAYEEALLCLAAAQSALDHVPRPMPVEKAQILNDIGWIHFRRGNLDQARTDLNSGLELVRDTTRYDVVASIYNRLGGVAYTRGDMELASQFARKSLALREELGDTVAVARSYNNLGLLGWRRGEWDGALEYFQRSVALHASLGDVEGTIEVHSNLGLLHLDRGDVVEARKHLDEALAAAQQIGHSYHVGLAYHYFSRLSASTDNWPEALDYANRSLGVLKEIGALDQLVDVHTNIGLAWLGLGETEEAQAWGSQALDMLVQMAEAKAAAQSEERGRALRLLGEICTTRGAHAEADQHLQESAAIFAAQGNQLEQGRAMVAQARLAAARSDRSGARVLLNEARLIFRQLGANLDLHKLEIAASSYRAER